MNMLENLFYKKNMTWTKVLVFALITGLLTAVIMMMDALYDTSFQDIGITLEWWILFSFIIIFNQESPLEAALKTFVFILVSRLVMLGLASLQDGFILREYRSWFALVALSFPVAYLAWFVKKQKSYSPIILFLFSGPLIASGAVTLITSIIHGPYHVLTSIFCILTGLLYIFVLLKDRRHQMITMTLSLVLTVALFFFSNPFSPANVGIRPRKI